MLEDDGNGVMCCWEQRPFTRGLIYRRENWGIPQKLKKKVQYKELDFPLEETKYMTLEFNLYEEVDLFQDWQEVFKTILHEEKDFAEKWDLMEGKEKFTIRAKSLYSFAFMKNRAMSSEPSKVPEGERIREIKEEDDELSRKIGRSRPYTEFFQEYVPNST